MSKLDMKSIRFRIESIDTLPTIPGVLKKLLKLVGDQKVSLNDIGHFVSSDPVLTTKVLKMVNSPVYGFPGRISSVSQAVLLLGLNVVKGLLLGVSVFELMQKSMVGLWEHSVGCSIVARLIARKKGLKEPEEVSVAGLLHDIGKVIMTLQFSEEYAEAVKSAENRGVLILEAEREVFSVTHANTGAWMTKKWRFPGNLTEAIEYHHKPHLSKQALVETSIVHLSDVLIRARGFGFAGDNRVPAVNPAAWESLGLTETDVKDVLRDTEMLLEGAGTLFVE